MPNDLMISDSAPQSQPSVRLPWRFPVARNCGREQELGVFEWKKLRAAKGMFYDPMIQQVHNKNDPTST